MAALPPILTLAHSPDPDDAFMWFPLAGIDGGPPLVDTGRFTFRLVLSDIESLNSRAVEQADLDLTAVSFATYPLVEHRYAITSCGASMGDGYGPKIVAQKSRLPMPDVPDHPDNMAWLRHHARLAVPGLRTSAYLTLCILLGGQPAHATAMSFDRIIDAVNAGPYDAGVVIHEGQLTFQDSGLVQILDLGSWWTHTRSAPMPLGANLIKRDLESRFGPGTLREITGALARSIQWSLAHRDVAVRYALRHARGVTPAQTDEFIRMYVNEYTLRLGDRGRLGISRLFADAAALGLLPGPVSVDVIEP